MSIISYFYCYFVDRNFYCIYSHKRFCSHLFHKINISHLVLFKFFKFKLDFIQINVFIDFYFNDLLMFLIFHLLKYISNWLQCFNYVLFKWIILACFFHIDIFILFRITEYFCYKHIFNLSYACNMFYLLPSYMLVHVLIGISACFWFYCEY